MGMLDDMGHNHESPASQVMRAQTLAVEPARRGAAYALPAWVTTIRDIATVVRPSLLPLALAPALCTVALLFAGEQPLDGAATSAALGAALFAMMGVGALSRWRAAAQRAQEQVWSPLRPDVSSEPDETAKWVGPAGRWALWVGCGSLAVAAACALWLALMVGVANGGASGVVVAAVGGACLLLAALSSVDRARRLIAPVDVALAAAALGPGVVVIVTLGQQQLMTPQTWLLAAAFGLFALAVLVARNLSTPEEARERRSLAALVGGRALWLIVALLLLAYGAAVAMTIVDGRLPGTLLALVSLPAVFAGVTGLMHSAYQPAREQAAERLAKGYLWFGIGGVIGLALIPTIVTVVAVFQLLIGG